MITNDLLLQNLLHACRVTSVRIRFDKSKLAFFTLLAILKGPLVNWYVKRDICRFVKDNV